MDSTTNKSQHSDNESNTSADLEHFLNDQTDSNVKSKIFLFSSEQKEDTSFIKRKKCTQKNIVQRLYHQKYPTIINSPKRASYYQRKLAGQHKHEEMSTEKKTSFQDAKNK